MYLGSLIKIYDIETLRNCFIYLDIDAISGKDTINIFVIHSSRNDLNSFIKYLKSLKGQIGFNNLNFDSQVCQFIINHEYKWQHLSPDEITDQIFKFVQELTNKQDVGFAPFNEKSLYCKQLDLYKLHHFDNKAKVQSLKGLQCNLNYSNCLEMPIKFTECITEKQLKEIIDYCKNDILSTKVFYDHKDSQSAIELRKGLSKSYNLPFTCINWSDSKIGSELILKFYCEHTQKDPKEVRKLRTIRQEIALKDCIPSNIKFTTKEFNDLLDKFRSTILYTHNQFKFGSANASENAKKPKNKRKEDISVYYKGLQIDYGIGGLHASKTGIFESTDEWLIYDIDVTSLYPSIAIANNLYPEHLGKEFTEVYKNKIVDVRLKEKAKGKEHCNNAIVLGLKNAANSVYGKSNDLYSFLYDPFYTFSTTISGQLVLSMLIEQLGENLNCKIIYINTDGASLFVHRNEIEQFREICSNWEKITKLQLEGYSNKGNDKEVIYKKLYLRDVNNYLAISLNGKIKYKGCFEKDKLLHKDPSARIITLAIENYVVNGVKVEDTINNHDIIWDFLIRTKFKRNSKGVFEQFKDGKFVQIPAQKVSRYYVANKGYILSKLYDSGKRSLLRKGWETLDANLIVSEKASDYDINRRHYIEETYKIIDTVEQNRVQLGLFN